MFYGEHSTWIETNYLGVLSREKSRESEEMDMSSYISRSGNKIYLRHIYQEHFSRMAERVKGIKNLALFLEN